MKMKMLGTAAIAGLMVTGCATDGNRDLEQAGQGAAIGAAAGAAVGAVTGVGTIEGAVAGAVLGGVAAAVINDRQYYRDTRGYCYYVDKNGNPVYDYDTRC